MKEIRRDKFGALMMVIGLGATSVSVVEDKVFVTYVCRGSEKFYRQRVGLDEHVDMTFTIVLERGPTRDAVLRRMSQ